MKRLGLIFAVFLCFGLFFVPNKSFASLTQSDLSRWNSYQTKALNDVGLGSELTPFSVLSSQVVAKYKNSNLTALEAVKYVISGPSPITEDYKSSVFYLKNGTRYYTLSSLINAESDASKKAKLLSVMNGWLSNEDSYTSFVATDTEAKRQEDLRNAEAGRILTEKANNEKKEYKCTLNPIYFSLSDCLDSLFAFIITHTLLQFVGYTLWLAATMMNYAIKVGILQFAQWAPDTLYPIWIVVRQIVSLFVVFAGLWLGFMYIIGKDEKFEKYIPWVVIFALFVNFSYPLARTIIDVSNVISLNVYSSAVGVDALNSDITSEKTPGAIIRNRLGLAGLVDYATGNVKDGEGSLNSLNSTPSALLAVIFIGYAAYIFFVVTALIVTRTAVLIFIIIASPLLFVDSVIPKLGDEAKKLRELFFAQLVVGPVFMIMLALTLKFLEVFQAGGPLAKGGSVASGIGSGQDAIATFFNMLMMLIMLHIMLKVTKSVSGSVGEMVTNAMGKVGGFALGAATGGTGFLARQSIGRGAANLRDHDWVKNNQHTFLGRKAYDMTNSVAQSSFDARNSGIVQTGTQKLGLGMGMGSKMDYKKELDAKIQDRKARYSRITTTDSSGKLDLNGMNAKATFYNTSGGSIFNKKEVQGALNEQDQTEAIKDNKKVKTEATPTKSDTTNDKSAKAEELATAIKNQKPSNDEGGSHPTTPAAKAANDSSHSKHDDEFGAMAA